MGCVQVVKVVPKQPTAKELEEKERAAQEELQRMDTDARLQVRGPERDSGSLLAPALLHACLQLRQEAAHAALQ
jgi:hypothetical protein